MNFEHFRSRGKEAIDFVCDYNKTLDERRVSSLVEPGYLWKLLPKEPPKHSEKFEDILKDIEKKIFPGLTHWQHSGFHAYFPNGRGHPSIIADIICNGIGCIGISWLSSPACMELETIMLDWLGTALSIPPHFLYSTPGSVGGGAIQCSATDCLLISLLTARSAAIQYLKEQEDKDHLEDSVFLSKLVAYTSREASASVERVANIAMVKLRLLDTDSQCSLRGPTLADAIHSDQDNGLHPFFVVCTLGTIGSCGFDNLKEIGPIVKKHPVCWLHVDGSYAGSGFLCPELRYLKEGIEFADSFNISCNKWLTICHDCSCLWVKDRVKLVKCITSNPVQLDTANSVDSVDYRNWGVQLSRRFRALKLWITFRMFGTEVLQQYIRNHCKLAKEFEKLVLRDGRFELCNVVRVGLVCFRLRGSDDLNQELLASINKEGKIHMIPAMVQGRFVLRFCVTHPNATQGHIDFAWNVIRKHATDILELDRKPTQNISVEEKKRFSFTEVLPHDIFEKHSMNALPDGSGLIYLSEKHDGTPSEYSKEVSDDVYEVFHDIK